MLTSKQQKILSKLDSTIENTITAMLTTVPKDEKRLFERLLVLVGGLKTRSNGTLVGSVDNLRIVNKIRNELLKLISDSDYVKSLPALSIGFKSVAEVANDYFGTIIATFKPSEALYTAIRESTIQTTTETLLVGGLNANFTQPVIRMLNQYVAGNSSVTSLTSALRQELLSTDESASRLLRYTRQTTIDSVEQFTRNYIDTVSQDLDLNYFTYSGTVINDSRPFCEDRAGKAYTRAEVESWASLKWSGKIPSTDRTSIFTYCGGYGCRHRLIPISEIVYQSMKQ